MAEKGKITIDFAEEECIDISIAFTPACSIYVVVSLGLKNIKDDMRLMVDYTKEIEGAKGIDEVTKVQQIKRINQELEVAKMAYNNSEKFLKELGQIIKELGPHQEGKKILIQKPKWTA